jgi:hypothetical protein
MGLEVTQDKIDVMIRSGCECVIWRLRFSPTLYVDLRLVNAICTRLTTIVVSHVHHESH